MVKIVSEKYAREVANKTSISKTLVIAYQKPPQKRCASEPWTSTGIKNGRDKLFHYIYWSGMTKLYLKKDNLIALF